MALRSAVRKHIAVTFGHLYHKGGADVYECEGSQLPIGLLHAALQEHGCRVSLLVIDDHIASGSFAALYSLGAAGPYHSDVVVVYDKATTHVSLLRSQASSVATRLGEVCASQVGLGDQVEHLEEHLEQVWQSLAGGDGAGGLHLHYDVILGEVDNCGKPFGPAVVSFPAPRMLVASTWDERGVPFGVCHIIYPPPPAQAKGQERARSALAMSLVTNPPTAADYDTHPGRLAPGYLWPTEESESLVHIGTVPPDVLTGSEHFLHQLILEEGRSYRVTARSDKTVYFAAADDVPRSVTSLVLPVSASGGNWSASGGYVAAEAVLLLSHEPGQIWPGSDGAVWFEGRLVGNARRPFGPAGQGKLFVPPSYHGKQGGYPAAVLKGLWLNGTLATPTDLFKQVSATSGSPPTAAAERLAGKMAVCEQCWIVHQAGRLKSHSCRKVPKATAPRHRPQLPAVDGLVTLLGEWGDGSMYAVRKCLKMSGKMVSAAGHSRGNCIVFIHRGYPSRNVCFNQSCEGQANRQLSWCVHLQAVETLQASTPEGLRLGGFMALVPGLLEKGRVCRSETCRKDTADHSSDEPASGAVDTSSTEPGEPVESQQKKQRCSATCVAPLRRHEAFAFQHLHCQASGRKADDALTITTAAAGAAAPDAGSGTDEDEENSVECCEPSILDTRPPSVKEIYSSRAQQEVRRWCRTWAPEFDEKQPVSRVKAHLIMTLHKEDLVSLLSCLHVAKSSGKLRVSKNAKLGGVAPGLEEHANDTFKYFAQSVRDERCVQGSLCRLYEREQAKGRELLKQVSAAQEDDGASLPTVPLDATQAEDILYAILLAEQRNVAPVIPLGNDRFAVLRTEAGESNWSAPAGYDFVELKLTASNADRNPLTSGHPASSHALRVHCSCSVFLKHGRTRLGGASNLTGSHLCQGILMVLLASILKTGAKGIASSSSAYRLATWHLWPDAHLLDSGEPTVANAAQIAGGEKHKACAAEANAILDSGARFSRPLADAFLKRLDNATACVTEWMQGQGSAAHEAYPADGFDSLFPLHVLPYELVCGHVASGQLTCVDPISQSAARLTSYVLSKAWLFVGPVIMQGSLSLKRCTHVKHPESSRIIHPRGVSWSMASGLLNIEDRYFFSLGILSEVEDVLEHDPYAALASTCEIFLRRSYGWMRRHRPDDPVPDMRRVSEKLITAYFGFKALCEDDTNSDYHMCLHEGCGRFPTVIGMDGCVSSCISLQRESASSLMDWQTKPLLCSQCGDRAGSCGGAVRKLVCGHSFCSLCVDRARVCPECKTTVRTVDAATAAMYASAAAGASAAAAAQIIDAAAASAACAAVNAAAAAANASSAECDTDPICPLWTREEFDRHLNYNLIYQTISGQYAPDAKMPVNSIPPMIYGAYSGKLHNTEFVTRGWGPVRDLIDKGLAEDPPLRSRRPNTSHLRPLSAMLNSGEITWQRLLNHAESPPEKLREWIDTIAGASARAWEGLSAAGCRAWISILYDCLLRGESHCHLLTGPVGLAATGGAFRMSCPHGKVIGWKHLMLKETTRSQADCLRSLNMEPRVAIIDGSCDLSAFWDGAYPAEARRKWHDRRGCWRPFVKDEGPELVARMKKISIPDLAQRSAAVAATRDENIQHARDVIQHYRDPGSQHAKEVAGGMRLSWHPSSNTQSEERYCVSDRFHQSIGQPTHRHPRCQQHLLSICVELGYVKSNQMELLNRTLSRRVRTTTNLDPIRHFKFTSFQHSWQNEKVNAEQWAHFQKLAAPGERVERHPIFGHAIFVTSAGGREEEREAAASMPTPSRSSQGRPHIAERPQLQQAAAPATPRAPHLLTTATSSSCSPHTTTSIRPTTIGASTPVRMPHSANSEGLDWGEGEDA